ncbi:D-fructose-6-phosphate amidotransferase [Aliivibrio sp. S4TY2]|uniref:D-fructose-6-phosphate amidotransferase n=1 Tax=unclassified Aliivibrio TaxID=2645654 RepID=UPI0023799DAE|nr:MULTISPECIES: D-fructose-6-phosphate amidotransferase [unclassified Aliivibrio]MDD9155221.1 D-fructose-6-phosphate amidotransferase [Aliivibrio sp. S4TY2]MDD9159227.1 D-fructose-6-phosphate amidotransferase [Aliivibrio sp. S4TY1]MDD9163223.1 D-fructose-6-phosphate amidotransferase [Aliivibrio sp. S4MY2]MDD9167226.1 D-fructose-6-phosphate amidotransferase [Aliivibrio sp. S4MY4]MDD9184300.1 D-fructose-6-phosphate amidotransferase [Aliivibrio sp. S4MY3]
MTITSVYRRDILGLVLLISIVLATLYLLLDLLALFAYLNHEKEIASIFFHQSFYFLVFFIPPYFIAKYIKQMDITTRQLITG